MKKVISISSNLTLWNQDELECELQNLYTEQGSSALTEKIEFELGNRYIELVSKRERKINIHSQRFERLIYQLGKLSFQ